MKLRPADLQNLINEEPARPHLSYSSLSTFINCGRRYEFERVKRLEPMSKSDGLSMGTAFTKGLEAGSADAGAEVLSAAPIFSRADEEKLQTDQAIVRAAITAYLLRYGSDHQGQREYGYRIRLRSPYTGAYSRTFDLLGYADGVIDHGDHLELIEDKFVGKLDAATVRRVKLDRQVGLEAYALWRVTGKPVTQIRYRFTKKPSIKQRQNESVAQFCERVTQDYVERPDFYLVEESTTRSPDDLLRLEAELWDWAEQLRSAGHRGFYARNTTSCTAYGGCPFMDLCSEGASALPLYRVRPERKAVAA
ncbi:PD-(D/E)XK nuclease family protein [Paraconexibacter antarcticus]|uniref:PD-(D/E)XK nuclease family protein n=1 Tax=Paraconexibacter antarcticus TaxID=2949664 RepID=A0ABY5DXM9_9ACTN|nr:PD-(D/E)XK nuclease family protein [Paraconexibacter antarcticus]UTI65587.1 PD-(D/E)XK nuclease family protein [Paraconexibacter antarcticus]